jgi:hypothetical protein
MATNYYQDPFGAPDYSAEGMPSLFSLSNLESLGRGSVAGLLDLPYMIQGMFQGDVDPRMPPGRRYFPSSEQALATTPRMTQPTPQAGLLETAGAFMSPVPVAAVKPVAKAVGRGGKAVARMAGQEITDVMSGMPSRSLLGDITPQPKQIIDHPFLKPSIALSSNPYSGLSGPDKTNMSRYIKKMSNPGFAAREIMRETGSTQMTQTANTTPNIISPVDMYRGGEPLVPVAGDTTRAGVQYTNVNGVPLAMPVDMQGGFQYPIIQSKSGSPNVWSSLDSAAMGKQSHIDKVAAQTNMTPRGVFFSMNPKDSPDFSTHISELIMQQLPALNPSAQAFKEANAIVQSKFPNFLGFDNPGAMAQLMDKDAGQLRKRVAFAAKQKRIEQLGFPSYDDIIQAANHPMLANAKVGDSGLATFFGLPGASLNPVTGHNTYNRGIIGAEAGSLPVSIPVQNMFPSIYEAAGLRRNKAGDLLSPDERAGVVKMSHQFQMPDQQWLDQIMPVYEAEVAKRSLSGGLLSSFP